MSKPPDQRPGDSFTEEETPRRFLEALKAGPTTPPKPLKDKPKTGKSKAEKDH